MVIFIQDNSTQFTTTSILSTISSTSVFALTTNVNNLSTNSTLSINNLNSTSNTIFNNLNNLSTNSTLSINNLNSTSNTIFNNLNSLSGQSYFLTNYTNLSSLNVSGTTKLNGATTCITTLNVVGNIIGSGTALTNLNYNAILNPPTLVSFNNPSTFVSTLNISGNATLNNATTINSSLNVVGNINTSGLSVFGINTNLNSLSTNSTLSINNLNSTSTTIFTNLNSLSTNSTLSINNLNATSTTIFNTLSGKQNNLTFSNPVLNTSNTISFKYNTAQFNIDASGNLNLLSTIALTTNNIICTNGLIVGNNNSYPDLKLGSANGNNIAIATTAGAFSTSANVNDMVVRSINRLLLQSGIGPYAILIDTNNYVTMNNRVGIQNTNPQSMLHLGNCEIANSAPVIIFGKNYNSSQRNAFMGYSDTFYFVIGDYGSTNAGINTLTQQLAIQYNAPPLSLIISFSGVVTMQYGYNQGSDERIKTNIKTIENALDKTLLLRGVEYNDIRIEPEKKKIGLIAQEVELIIPEVVTTGDDGMKSIAYQNLVGLLVEAIKDQQKQINDLKNILKKNNLN